MNNVPVYQKTGSYHLLNGLQSQDVVWQAESNTAKICAIADGVSACENGKRGAEIACESASRVMLDETEYMFSASEGKVANLLSSYIRQKLTEEAAIYNNCLESYASTLSFVCYNKLSGEVMTFVLGDSLIYLVEQGSMTLCGEPRVSYDGMTYTTTTKNVADVVDIKISQKSDVKFLLATDGAWKTFYSGDSGSLSFEMLQAVKENDIAGYLENQRCADDCSVIMMDIPKGV